MSGRGRSKNRSNFGSRGGKTEAYYDGDGSSQAIQINLVIPTQQSAANHQIDMARPQSSSADRMFFDDPTQLEQRNERYDYERHDAHLQGVYRDQRHNTFSDPRCMYESERPDYLRNTRPSLGRAVTANSERDQRTEIYRHSNQSHFNQRVPTNICYDIPTPQRPSLLGPCPDTNCYHNPRQSRQGNPTVGDRWRDQRPDFISSHDSRNRHYNSEPHRTPSHCQDPPPYRDDYEAPNVQSLYRQGHLNQAEVMPGTERGEPSLVDYHGPGFNYGFDSRRPPEDLRSQRPPSYESLYLEESGKAEDGGRVGQRGPGQGRGREGRVDERGREGGGERGRGGRGGERGRGRGGERGRGRGGERGRGRGGERGRGRGNTRRRGRGQGEAKSEQEGKGQEDENGNGSQAKRGDKGVLMTSKQDKSSDCTTNIQSAATKLISKGKNKAEKQVKDNNVSNQKSKDFKQSDSKIVITIAKRYESTEHVIKFLQEAVGEMSSHISEDSALVSLLTESTVCECIFASKDIAHKLTKILNEKLSGVKVRCMPYKAAKGQQKVKDVKVDIDDAFLQIKERTEEELSDHASKIFQTGKTLLDLQSLPSPNKGDDEDDKAQVVFALVDKLRELESQKKEFENRIEKLKATLSEHKQSSTSSQRDVDNILRDVGIECKRLSAGLPMYARRSDLLEKIKSNQVSIILGETGSGKSTQLAQYMWEEGLARSGQIVCTQPRKVAAITLAERVSTELVRKPGSLVGYKAGMRQKSNKDTKILFYTDHTLLNECLKDPILSKYSCIIIDEAHERSIYTDILLGMIKSFLPQRPDLKLVITSATINPEVFIRYFNTSPELRVSGRAFPVDVIYEDADNSTPFENYEKKAVDKVVEIHKNGKKGDILVFLTSSVEIMRCCEELTNRLAGKTDFVCFPLHGQLPPEEQRKVFKPLEEGKRKIIFSTNCAETSITINGIKFVVDTGVVNEMRFDPRKNMSSLGIQIVSQSSANQRKGRAGRTASGTCYRLYTEASYESMVTINQPEILRVHLGQAVLKLAELGVDVRKYDFVESPKQEAIDSAISVLQELNALTLDNALITEVGRWLSKLPFDPRQSYVIYLGHQKELLYDAVTLATLISNGSNMIYRGFNEAEEQVAARTKNCFGSLKGDLFMWFEIFKSWMNLPRNDQTSWCRKNCVNYKVLSLTKQTIAEIIQILTKDLNITFESVYSDNEDSLNVLRRLVFEANLPALCHYSGHKRGGYFAASTGQQVHPHPSSNLKIQNHYPEWVIYTHLIKTSRDFICGITMVEESWIKHAVLSRKLPMDFLKVREKKILSVFHKEIGQTILHKLVGPHFSHLRSLEEGLVKDGMLGVVVEADKEFGTFDVHSSVPMHPLKAEELNHTIDETISHLRQENEELPVGQDKSGVRALLGEGGSVAAIFMPHESNKVRINLADSETTEQSVLSKFSAFGKITECIKFKKGVNWGYVKYVSSQEARAAVDATMNDCDLKGSLMTNAVGPKKSEFEARISWCRRPIKGKGTAIIQCPPLEKCTLNGMIFKVGIQLCTIKVSSKNEDELIVFNTGDASEQEIKKSILANVNWNDKKKNQLQVNVIREQVDLNPEKLITFKERLTKIFAEFVSTNTFSIRFLEPKKGSPNYVAFISFTNAISGFLACRKMRKRNIYIDGQRLIISPDLKTRINIPKGVMKVCQTKFDMLKQCVEKDDIGVTLNFRKMSRGDFSADIVTSDEECMVRMRTAIQNELEGDVINCSQNNILKSLLKKQGIEFLRKLECEIEEVLLMPCTRIEKVRIFGSDKSVTLAKAQINDYLDKVSEGLYEDIYLRGQGRPVGLMKALMRQFPELCEDFVRTFGVEDITIDYKRHILSVTGSKDSLAKINQTINNIQKNMPHVTNTDETEQVMPDCVTCMCPVDDSTDFYRLEGCGHGFCFACLRMQLGVQVEDKQFPLVCADESCGKPWVWKDIKTFLKLGWIKEGKLVERAIDAFVAASGDGYKFCSSPNCPIAYEVTEVEEGCEFICPSCDTSLCSSCHTAYHAGLTCRQAASVAKGDLSLEQWKKQNSDRCKACPGCNAPVEKSGGCNKMHCKCGAYFCWLCLANFDNEQSCYAHLAKEHGGFS